MTFVERYGPWALVTGASAGIGAEFARQLSEMGLNLVVVARRRQRLEDLARDLESRNKVQVRIVTADLSQPTFLPLILSVTNSIEVGLLVNNAGFGLAGYFLEHALEEELRLLERQLPRAACVDSCIRAPNGPAQKRRNHFCFFCKRIHCDSV